MSGKYSDGTLSDTGEPFRKVRIMNDGLINREYVGWTDVGVDGDETQAYRQIVGFNKTDVEDLSAGNYIIDTIGTTRVDNQFGVGFPTMLPAATYSTNDRSTSSTLNMKAIGSIPGKLDRVFDRLSNQDIFDIDIMPEGGLGTIQTTIQNTTNSDNFSTQFFDDRDALTGMNQLTATSPTLGSLATAIRSDWNSVQTKFITFAQNTRKDFIYVSDPIRQIFVQGENTKVINIPGNTFPINILQPLKNCYSLINTNYAAAYATWAQVLDNNVSGQVWMPMSGIAAAKYAQTDAAFAPWYAPAGFTRGLLDSINDVAIYPNQKQRDSIYDQTNTNPVAFFASEGYVIYGQKTLQTKPSAFDRINVRRLFIYLEKRVKETVKYFVFEPNTLFTRTNVLNVINPIMEDAKNNEGLYDYLVVCDERNNTPEVIDANELVVDIYLKPVRAAEFILVNFYATRTGQDFSEIVG
jgi:phage tail sheath protein FI